MDRSKLKKTINDFPKTAGIYVFKNKNQLLYIGKASNLKGRLNSYLKTEDPRIKRMLDMARTLKFLRTKSDIEALILESQLIKNFRPQFNIVMRDDKQYFYVGFTKEKFPKIFITHQPWTSGACPSSPRTGSVLLDLHATEIPLSATDFVRPMEPSPNTGVPTRVTPRSIVHNFIGPFTDGNALKITLRFLRSVFPYCTCKQLHHNYCLNYHIGKCLGFCCLKKQLWVTDFASRLSTGLFNPTTYKKNIMSVKMVLSGKKRSVIKNLEKEMTQSTKIGSLEKAIELREKLGKLKRIFENARIIRNSKFIIHNSKSTEKNSVALKDLAKILKLNKTPIHIEGYDVSNIQGDHATGAMVTFIHGRPDKNFYRKFKIYTKQTADDTAMLKEILERRFRHEEWPFPDLILVDGGKGQLSAALKVISKKIPIIGISKNERHLGHQLIIPGRKNPLPLTKLSLADRNLLLQIDSEAHRFAIGYYRKLHRKLFR